AGNPGGPKTGVCEEAFPYFPAEQEGNVKLTADPDSNSYFAGWTGDAFDGNCNSGSQNPCAFTDFGEFEVPPFIFTIAATFEPLPGPPVAITGGTSPGPNEQLITLEGSVNPAEFEVGDCHFEYGPTSEYGLSTPCVPGASELGEGSADVAVSGEAEIEQLKPSTTYHYRLVATNPGGAGKGEDRTFTTDPAPPDSCPNAAFRDVQEFAVIMLPGCM